ncbi:MAG: hypothetical protein KF799_01005 [Bdellovibrionales bacterium]|nr:hypothetical protein [Bdellovibrionales bacterium]
MKMFLPWFRRASVELSKEEQSEIRDLCLRISNKLQGAGKCTEAFSSDKHELPRDIRERIELMRIYDQVLTAHLEEGSKDHRNMLWKFFSKMGYAPTSDIFDRIEDGDIIEVYSMDHQQLYRNLNYFDVVSMTVEDLINLNWQRAYKRNRRVMLHLIGLMVRFTTGTFHQTYNCTRIPVHQVQEMLAKRYLVELNFRYISPLKKNGKCVAVLVGTRCRLLKPERVAPSL